MKRLRHLLAAAILTLAGVPALGSEAPVAASGHDSAAMAAATAAATAAAAVPQTVSETVSENVSETGSEAVSGTAATETSAPKTVRKRFLPTRRRMDREINKIKYAYRGEIMLGTTASYGTLSTDEADVWTIVSNISAEGAVASVKPFLGYFYRDNRCIGVRFGYQHTSGKLKNTEYDLGSGNDLSGAIPYFDINSNSYSFGLFHRSYAGLDPAGRIGLFAEFEFLVTSGTADFVFDNADNRTYSDNMRLKLSFIELEACHRPIVFATPSWQPCHLY